MHFKINKKVLLKSINNCAKAISSQIPLPQLSNYRLLCNKDHLEITASDSKITIKEIIKNNEHNSLEIFSTGGFLIDSHYFLDVIKNLDGDVVEVSEIDTNYIRFSANQIEYKINVLKVEHYPNIDFRVGNTSFKIKTSLLFEIIDEIIFAIGDNEFKTALTGVNFITKNNQLIISASDSFRLARKTIDLSFDSEINIVVSPKFLRELKNIITDEEEIELYLSDKKIQAILGDLIIQSTLIDDKFPDVSKLLSNEFSCKVEILLKPLLSAIEKSLFIRNEGKSIVNLEFKDDLINVSCSNREIGSFNLDVSVLEKKGNDLSILCSGKYLFDAFKAFNTKEINLNLSDPNKPIIITSKEKPNLIQLISLIRRSG